MPVSVVSQLEAWLSAAFGDTSLAQASATADPDRDGQLNLLEFGFGLNPNQPDLHRNPFIAKLVTDNNQRYLQLTFRRKTSAMSGISYAPMVTDDLAQAWQDGQNAFVLHGSPINHGDRSETETYRSLLPISSQPFQFAKIEISPL